MLKISSTESVEPRKSRVGVNGDNRAGRDKRCKLDRKKTSDNEIDNKVHNKVDNEFNNEVDDKIDNEVDDEVGKKRQKTSKSKNLFKKLSKSKKMIGSDFLTSEARLVFTKLRQAFIKTSIL